MNRSRTLVGLLIAIVLVIAIFAILPKLRPHGKPPLVDTKPSPAHAAAGLPAYSFNPADDYIGFHGGGPLLGVAPPIGPTPLAVRWKFQTDDDQPDVPTFHAPAVDLSPTPGPATRPTTLPTTGPTTKAATQSAATTNPAVAALPAASAPTPLPIGSSHPFVTAPVVQASAVIAPTVPATASAPSTTQPATSKFVPTIASAGSFEAAAAIVGGVAYIGDSAGVLRAIDIATGKVKWQYIAEDGFETTPLVLDGRVLLGDKGGIFHAVSAATGKNLWVFEGGGEIHSSANYLGLDRRHIVFGDDSANVFCLDAVTGAKVWEMKSGDRVNGTPAVSNGSALVSGCDAQLRAMRGSDGAEQFAIDLGALCPGSTAVAGDRLVAATDQGRVLCLSAKTQQQLWLFDQVQGQAMVYSSPAISQNIVVVGTRDRNVYGLNLATGAQIWSFATHGDVDSSPVISGNRVFIGGKDKRLYVLDLKTGKQLWTFTAGRAIIATPAIGDSVLIFGDTGGNLFCLQ